MQFFLRPASPNSVCGFEVSLARTPIAPAKACELRAASRTAPASLRPPRRTIVGMRPQLANPLPSLST
eukprot:7382670-Prymnesium_polylepis.1